MADGAQIGGDAGGEDAPALELVARDAASSDADRAVVRIDPADLKHLGARTGDLIRLEAEGITYARALPAQAEQRGARSAHLDSVQRTNLGVGLGEPVRASRAEAQAARRVLVVVTGGAVRLGADMARRVKAAMEATPAFEGDALRIRLIGGRVLSAEIQETEPAGPVIVTAETVLDIEIAGGASGGLSDRGAYAEIAGLDQQLAKVREMVELPLRRPDLFSRLGLEPPKGVLFVGPPGTGKTLLARAVARETDAAFFQLNGPEIVSKHYGDSEGRLREIFKKAGQQSPSVIFIDEIDAIAPKRDNMAGDRQLERRIVAQLLTLMDGLAERDGVIVMAASNLPDSLDPALRRPGRFDREIDFGPPDRAGRAAILAVHSRRAPLASDVDLDEIAGLAHGFVGADLAALVREAGLAALRRTEKAHGGYPRDLGALEVEMVDFEAALGEVRPSAVREVYTETPDVRWSDVGGAADAKQALIEAVVWPLRHGEAHRALGLEPAKGVLLAGPPGCGKTHLARALANEAGVNFIAIRGAQLLNRHLGESERAVRDVFAKARQSAPCVIFFDEIDALAPPRGDSDNGAAARVVATLLTEIDGIEELRGVFLLGATNRVDQIDPALLRSGRFDQVLTLNAPDVATRREILDIHTRALPLSGEVSLDELAHVTAGLVGADLRTLCQAAGRQSLRRSIATDGAELAHLVVYREDFDHALAAHRASDVARRTGSKDALGA